ncbi:MAG: hypothetical protein H6735_08035 [Alphaproteobacteria bacterium]|nr:hypothetical protein [Alphaproteobacteria bacterium]
MSHDPNEPDPSSTSARVERLLAEAEVLLVTAAEEGGPVTVFAQHLPSGARSQALRASELTDEGKGLVREVRDLVDPAHPLESFSMDPAASVARHASRTDVVPWALARTGAERALDALMADLCDVVDTRTRGRLVLACARVTLPTPSGPVLNQLTALEAWLETPTPMAREAMLQVLDDTRQPSWANDAISASEVADLALRSVLQPTDGRYAELGHELTTAWSGPESARRAVVCCHKLLGGDAVEGARALVVAMRDTLG